MSLQADLTDAQLLFGSMGWTKPAGRARHHPVRRGADRRTARPICKNLKILGDDINIDGGIALDPEQHLKSFYFSDFSFDFLTHVEITATVRDDKVLDIKANGPSYDGKQFFQSLFSAGQLTDDGSSRAGRSVRHRPYRATSARWSGFYDTTAQQRACHLQEAQRPDRCARCQGRAERQDVRPRSRCETNGGTRVIKAEARDAGAAFRLVGFYPKRRRRRGVARGQSRCRRARHEERDAVGARLYRARRLGGERRAHRSAARRPCFGQHKQQVARAAHRLQAIARAVLGRRRQVPLEGRLYERAACSAPPCAARVDFKAQTVDLGGTYVPLYGLNSALRGDPHSRPRAGRPPGRGRGRHYLRHQGQARRPARCWSIRCR